MVVGVGINCDLSFTSHTEFDFDDSVKAFCSAVASKSAYIGVRGEQPTVIFNDLVLVPSHE